MNLIEAGTTTKKSACDLFVELSKHLMQRCAQNEAVINECAAVVFDDSTDRVVL